MIKFVLFKENANNIASGSMFDFKPGVNLLVGDQGCGKSTLLSQIEYFREANSKKKKFASSGKCKIDLLFEGEAKKFGYFDFEKHNPRTQPGLDMGYGYDTNFQVSSMFSSHGETVRALLYPKGTGPFILILDEPDMALSLRSIHQLVDWLKKVEKDGTGQVIMSAHNPYLISCFDNVLSLEHGKWMKSEDFLNTQINDPAPKFSAKEPRRIEAMRFKPKKKKDKADEVVDELLKD